MRPYQDDLAYIHDRYFTDLARQAAQEILHLLPKPAQGSLIDLGCGTGILAAALTEAGIPVTGVDISAGMLKIARKRAPKANFVQASVFDYEFSQAQAVTAIGEPLNYLFDPQNSYEALAVLLGRIHDSLSDKGIFLFDALTTEVPPGPISKVFEQPDTTLFVEINVDPTTAVLERKIISFRKEGNGYRKSTEVHRQLLFERGRLRTLLEGQGFKVQETRAYADMPFRQGHFGYVCLK